MPNILTSENFYDRLARAFDVMTDWPQRLAQEMPFLQKVLEEHGAKRVLDTACGTGWHAITLVKMGYYAVGCDASPEMIARARANATQEGVNVSFVVASFNELNKLKDKFDAVLCLGNSLPHLLTQKELKEALRQMRSCLNPQGVLILQNLNYDLRLKKKPRFFAVNGNDHTLVWRFADYGSKFITFHIALFEKKIEKKKPQKVTWSVEVNSTLQKPLLKKDLQILLQQVGFKEINFFGGLDGSPFVKNKSADLVIVAHTTKIKRG
ncbi:MAG: class I SAM-dependent methyltransferase [Thermodesulfobacteriota bacterium]